MIKKKASVHTIWTILKQCVYPKFTYILKFSNISMYDLNNLSGTLRDLLRTKSNASHLPNAILFADSKCSYGHKYYDLMAHTIRDKESTMLRMLGGAPYSRQIMHCLLSRGQRLISDNQSFSLNPVPCPQLPHYMCPTEQAHYSWALSLIQYLQISQSNIHTTQLFPQHNTNKICTQTPIHTYYNTNEDAPLTLNEILDFETSYHLYFVEELFPYPPIDPSSFLLNLLPLFPPQYHGYIAKATNIAFMSHHLSLGQVILREHTIIQLPHTTSPSYIEGVHHTTSSTSFAIRTQLWDIPRNTPHQPSNLLLTLPHSRLHTINTHDIPPYPITTTRYIHSSIGYNNKAAHI